MIKDFLLYLFTDSISKMEVCILIIITTLIINKKYKKALITFLIGGLIISYLEVLLNI